MRVEVKSRLLRQHDLGREQMVESMVDSTARWLDAAITSGIEETDQPVGGAQTTAANIK